MHIWRVNVRKQEILIEDIPHAWENLGGRGLIARILLDEVTPTCDPLGIFNKLLFAPGLLTGHMLSSCDRISIGAKSPLTRGVKESNAGGITGYQMACLGIKSLIIEDKPEENGWWVLHLSNQGGRFDLATDLAGLGVYESARRLFERYGKRVALALIGPGGERRLASAGIQNVDKDKTPSRIAARGGIGAVMGSKGLKAIVIDGSDSSKPPIIDLEKYRNAHKGFVKALMDHPQTSIYRDYGTAANARIVDSIGGLPTRNFSSGRFEEVEGISGEFMREIMLERGGDSETSHACMPGCTIRSSNIFAGADGRRIVAPLEYETIALLGPNLGISDLDVIGALTWELNDLGIDSIEIGNALGVAAEVGVWSFGNWQQAKSLLDQIRQNTPLGRILGNGCVTTGQVLGVRRIPAVKGQAMAAYDPRAIKGTGVTYATSPQGADHTCGLTFRHKVDHLNPAGQADLSRTVQINMAGYDTLGACIFTGFGFGAAPTTIPDLLNARYGWRVDEDILQTLGRQTLSLEREFNRLAGFTSAHDRIPEWMEYEPLPPHNSVFDVPYKELDGVFNW
jgi:aldehyde:ferredoxin oxidoreductase